MLVTAMASSTGRPMLRILNENDLSQIPDLITAFAVMQDLNIDMNGVSDMNDALARIRQNFRQSTAQQIYNEQVGRVMNVGRGGGDVG